MPIISVDMWAGRAVDEKRRLVRELTDAFVRVTGVSPQGVQVLLRDVPRDNWGVGGELHLDRSKP